MSKSKFIPPTSLSGQFHCPHCDVFAKQRWSYLEANGNNGVSGLTPTNFHLSCNWKISNCEHCYKFIIWNGKTIIYPKKISVGSPNDDLSDEIKNDYIEAANILTDSPRAAAAILRLALQKLCTQLGEKGENINDDIGSLVKKGLNLQVQKALDSLRITGNNAVHPGQIDLSEDIEKVTKLFDIINFIADKMITEPKQLDDFYDELPEDSRKAVEKRDGEAVDK